MAKISNAISARGTVLKQISAKRYRVAVKTDSGSRENEYDTCRKFRKTRQTLKKGDPVYLELDKHDLSKGQIMHKMA